LVSRCKRIDSKSADLARRQAGEALIGVGEEGLDELRRCAALAPQRRPQQAKARVEALGRVDAQGFEPLVLHHVMHAGCAHPLPDPRGLLRRAAFDIALQLGVAPPRTARHLVHAELKLVVLQPVRLSQQRIQHRRLVDVRERDPEVRAKLPVRGPEQE
jgi:hypothetical protein